MLDQAGQGEVVPGFGGLFLDASDNTIGYVYMLDPSQQEAAEEAADTAAAAPPAHSATVAAAMAAGIGSPRPMAGSQFNSTANQKVNRIPSQNTGIETPS